MSESPTATVAEPVVRVSEPNRANKPKRQPRYNVILWNDDDHSYDYVIQMMIELFNHDQAAALLTAFTVDKTGKAICLTTTREHAELKRDQIHSFGPDKLIARCQGAMSASIEPLPD